MDAMPYMAYGGATTFSDAFAAMEAEEAARKMHEHTYLFQEIVSNILGSDAITDKAGAIAAASGELKAIMAMSEKKSSMVVFQHGPFSLILMSTSLLSLCLKANER